MPAMKKPYYNFDDIALDYDIDTAATKVGMTAGEAFKARPLVHVDLAYSVIGGHTILINRRREGFMEATVSIMFPSGPDHVEAMLSEYGHRLRLRAIDFTLTAA